jgi:hypothetical protein
VSFLNSAKIQRSQLQQKAVGQDFVKTPTFVESVTTAFDETRATELFTSERRMEERFLGPGKQELEGLRDSGAIPQEVWDQHADQPATAGPGRGMGRPSVTDWEALAAYSNENLGTDLDLSEESMHAAMQAESDERRAILANVEGLGYLGAFFGGGGAMLTDPVQVAAMFTPMGTMRFGASTFSTVARMAFKEGAINVGIESVNQMHIANFKKRIGIEYHLSEAAANLTAAFVFGGAVGGVRSGYRIKTGDASVSHAVEANEVIIAEMEKQLPPTTHPKTKVAEGLGGTNPLKPSAWYGTPLDVPFGKAATILEDLKLTNEVMKELAARPGWANRSAREGYQHAWQALENMNVTAAAATPGSAVADDHVNNVTSITDGVHPFEQYRGKGTPKAAPKPEPKAPVDEVPERPVMVFEEDGSTRMTTVGDEIAEAEELVDAKALTYEKLMGCLHRG